VADAAPATARAVTLYLDAPGTPEWTALYTLGDEIRLAAPLLGYVAGSGLDPSHLAKWA
jgi:hypothetical protein